MPIYGLTIVHVILRYVRSETVMVIYEMSKFFFRGSYCIVLNKLHKHLHMVSQEQ